MKTLLIIMALTLVFFCGVHQAKANPLALCTCHGVEGQEKMGCGNGATGGNQGQWVTIYSKDIGRYLKDSYTLWKFNWGQHALDPITGWYCYDKATWR
jgi:hypothetical protein